MSSRNRGRGSNNQDTDEERRLWKEIKDKAAEVDAMVVRVSADKPHRLCSCLVTMPPIICTEADLESRLARMKSARRLSKSKSNRPLS